MKPIKNLLIYGGSFNPIHNGHLNTALNVQKFFKFEKFIFVPCKKQVLKEVEPTSVKHRINMLKLALKSYPQFAIDLREVNRETPSYMIETLTSLECEYKAEYKFILMLGEDSFQSLPNWHSWQQLLKMCNILVIKRNCEFQINPEFWEFIKERQIKNPEALLKSHAGKIYFFNAGMFDMSSSAIRNAIKNHKIDNTTIPEEVLNYIKTHNLYKT